MDTITLISTIAGAIGLSSAVQLIVTKWANRKKDDVDVRSADIANREKEFTMLSGINDKLVDEMAELTQKLIEARSQMAEVVNHKITLIMENADLKAQNELFKKENQDLKIYMNELQKKILQMEDKIKKLEENNNLK
jgi:chromosome segregation ATPase